MSAVPSCTPHHYKPSPRIKKLRERALSQPPELSRDAMYRPYYYLEGWMAAGEQPLPVRNATALANVVEKMPVQMVAGEVLVGEHSNPDQLLNFRPAPLDGFDDALTDSPLSDSEKRRLRKWLKQEPFAYQRLSPVAPYPEELENAQAHGVVSVWGTDLNHSIRNYEKVLTLGFEGIRGQVAAALDGVDLSAPEAPVRRANLLAWMRLCEAAMKLGKRHAERARELAAECDDPQQQADWEAIAERCDRVPAGPARSFADAIQSLWFAHMITVWEDGVNANGIGRLDQFMWPYLERDLLDGTVDHDEAAELLGALWIKLYQTYDVQQIMLGGQQGTGEDATNPLSYMALDVTEGLDFIRCLSVRLHRNSPREFVSRCVDLLSRGGGIPFIFNDEALVPALVSKGIPMDEARGYAAIGCIEITIPGRASPHAVSHWINAAKCLELALNDGCCLLDGEQIGPATGTLAEFRSMDDVLAAYGTQLRHFADLAVHGSNLSEIAHRSQYRLPYLSLLTDDCIRRGLDIIEGGARYNYHSSAAMGIPNVADSLAALEQAVFTDAHVSAEDLLEALRTDFADSEELRMYLHSRVPKYGNDQALPDGYAADLARQYCELLGTYETPSGGTYFVHLFTFRLLLSHGAMTGATPDGRHAREPLAYSISPVQGRDREGLTALINSLSRIPHDMVAASSAAIIEAHPSLFRGADGHQAFTDLLTTAIDRGVGQMQINVVSAEQLVKAQENPEAHRNLAVRVAGFSQQFILLDRQMQDHIIARTKHDE